MSRRTYSDRQESEAEQGLDFTGKRRDERRNQQQGQEEILSMKELCARATQLQLAGDSQKNPQEEKENSNKRPSIGDSGLFATSSSSGGSNELHSTSPAPSPSSSLLK